VSGPVNFIARIRTNRAMITTVPRPSSERAVSLGALRLHAQGLLASFESGHAGFVPDRYLAAFGPDTAPAVLELCLAGVWSRVGTGYEVASSEALRMAAEVHRQTRARQPAD
jgi:hypothetical protein